MEAAKVARVAHGELVRVETICGSEAEEGCIKEMDEHGLAIECRDHVVIDGYYLVYFPWSAISSVRPMGRESVL